MQVAATVVFIVTVVMFVAWWSNQRTAARTAVRIGRRVVDTRKGKRNG